MMPEQYSKRILATHKETGKRIVVWDSKGKRAYVSDSRDVLRSLVFLLSDEFDVRSLTLQTYVHDTPRWFDLSSENWSD